MEEAGPDPIEDQGMVKGMRRVFVGGGRERLRYRRLLPTKLWSYGVSSLNYVVGLLNLILVENRTEIIIHFPATTVP